MCRGGFGCFGGCQIFNNLCGRCLPKNDLAYWCSITLMIGGHFTSIFLIANHIKSMGCYLALKWIAGEITAAMTPIYVLTQYSNQSMHRVLGRHIIDSSGKNLNQLYRLQHRVNCCHTVYTHFRV